MQKRSVDVVVVSDLHLGTYACRAKEFLSYLKSISPRLLYSMVILLMAGNSVNIIFLLHIWR